MRIVSLYPAGTEIVFALGAGDEVVGVSHACDYPPEVQELDRATRPRFDPSDLSGPEIHEARLEADRQFGSQFRLSESSLWSMRPDVMVVPGPSDLPPVSLENVRAIAEGLNPRPQLVILYPRHLDDVINDHARIGFEIGRMADARQLRDALWERIDTVEGMVGEVTHRSVAFIQWAEPLLAGGYWIPQLIEIAGGVDVLGTPGVAPNRITPPRIRQRDPDVIVFACDEMSSERTREEIRPLFHDPYWVRLRAVQRDRVFVADGRYFTRPGPRLVDGLEALAWAIHPELFAPPRSHILWTLRD